MLLIFERGTSVEQTENRTKRPYEPPKLVEYGELQKLTRGGTSGANDGTPGVNTKTPACWIAEALYGVNDSRTHLLRAWLNTEYANTPIGGLVVGAYRMTGRQVAAVAKRSAMVRAVLRPVFDEGLRQAQRHYMNAAG